MLRYFLLFAFGFGSGYAFKVFYPISFFSLSAVEFLNITGTWLSAIGTLFAVGCAIYYSEKSHKLQTPSVKLTAFYSRNTSNLLSITVTNNSYAPLK